MQSCRNVLMELKGGSNAGLLMARYLKAATDGSVDFIKARKVLFEQMKNAAEKACDIYEQAFKQRQNALDEVSTARVFETVGPMVVGLGGSNVLEVGLTLNTLYGAPMIPGTSIKGITAHYCSQVLGATDGNENYKGPALNARNQPTQQAGIIYEALFGKVDQSYDVTKGVIAVPLEERNGGYLHFYDAWILPESFKDALTEDVMTPHHGAYYSCENDLPTDFDNPTPISFMTIQGKFEVRIGCEEPDPEERKKWQDFAMKLIQEALKSHGVGGKIRAGYGRMKFDKASTKALQKQISNDDMESSDEQLVKCSGLNRKGNPQFKYRNKKAIFDPLIGKDAGYKPGAVIKNFVVISEPNDENDCYVLKLVDNA